MTLADTIHAAMAKHLDSGNVVLGQNVGEGLGDTIPTNLDGVRSGVAVELQKPAANTGVCSNLITLSTSDCSNAGVAAGFALAGRRPVFVVRFQPLLKFALPALEYAAKSKALWGVPCPIFVRAAALEGGIGPVCSGVVHGLGMRVPGLKVVAPMTAEEWRMAWNEYLVGDDPVLCSEQRSSWGEEFVDDVGQDYYVSNDPIVTVLAVGEARRSARAARKEKRFLLHPLWQLKPLVLPALTKRVLVVDCEPTICGTAEHVAMEVHRRTGARVEALGLEDRAAGFSPDSDVRTPNAEAIIEAVKRLEAT